MKVKTVDTVRDDPTFGDDESRPWSCTNSRLEGTVNVSLSL